jgi:hypothetical protein
MENNLSSLERAYNSLKRYYESKGITNECDIESKYRALSEIVQISDFPEEEKIGLLDLEHKFLVEHSSL